MAVSFEKSSFWQRNHSLIDENIACQRIILEFSKVEQFLDDFGYLSFGRDLLYAKSDFFPYSNY